MLLAARTALAFLSILPIRLPEPLAAECLRRSAGFFPLAGWLFGLILVGLTLLFEAIARPSPVAAGLLVASLAWLTRGLHLDGLADLLDGLGGGRDPARRLAIMKDSAIGAFGVIGLILLLGLKTACLVELINADRQALFFALSAAPVAARWAMASLAWRSRYPREQGTAHAFVGRVGGVELGIGLLFLLPLFAWNGIGALAICAAAAVPALILRYSAPRALGGVTGDVLGAACELGELAGWLAAVVVLL